MTFIVADRVQETTNSPGTGTATLLGAVSGYQSFSTGVGINNTTFYVIADQLGTNWEVGLGALNSTGTVLTRTTVYSSSNGGSTVNFATGTQYVWCDFPASKSVLQGAAANFSSIGATTAGTGAFTTLSASSTVSGAGFSNYFAAPPTIGNTTPNAGTFTALVATSITDSGLTAGRVNYNGVGGLLQDSANMTFDGSTLTTLNSAYTGTFTGGTGVVNLGSGQFYKDASGNVGIGTASPSCKLDINRGSAGLLANLTDGVNANFQIKTASSITTIGPSAGSTNFAFQSSNTEAMRIDSSGNLLVGTTTTSGDKLTIAANGASQSHIRFIDTNTSGKTWVMGPGTGSGAVTDFGFYNITNGNLVGRATSSGVWYQANNSATWSIVSDERIKENISTLDNGLSIITALRPVEFDYKISKTHDIGFIAQEYQKVLPEQINENEPTSETKEFIEDNKLLGITSNLVPYLVSAIQELNAKVTALEAQLGAK